MGTRDQLLLIDDCVAQYGLRNGNLIHAEVLSARCLRVALEAVNLADSIKSHQPDDRHLKELPLVDIEPSILRNLFADFCSWIVRVAKGPRRYFNHKLWKFIRSLIGSLFKIFKKTLKHDGG